MTDAKALQLSDAAAEWLLAALGRERLFATVMAAPLLQDAIFRGGFQAAPATLDRPAVKCRLRAMLLGRPERVEALLRETDHAPWAAAVEFIGALDEAWLRRHWRGLLRGSANPAFAVALAVDLRPALRQRGRRLFARTALWQADWPARPELLPGALRALLLKTGSPGSAVRPAAPAEDHAAVADLRAALVRQREKVREGQHDLRQAQQAWEQHEKDLRRELREARTATERITAGAAQQVADAIRDFKHESLGITADLRQIASAADAPGTGALLQRAEVVLEEQRQQNEAHGTYESVRARRRALAAMAQRLSVCMDESIRVLPEVRRLHVAICRELDRLRALLPEESAAPELVAQLLGRIKEPAQSDVILAELDRIEPLLGVEALTDLLGPDGLRQVREALTRRRRQVQAAVHAPLLVPAAPAANHAREIWDVRTALAASGAPRAWVFVDGYNVIRRVADLAAMERIEGLPRSREAFCQMCRQRSRAFVHLEVVFDGQGALSAREESNGFAVVFSKGLRESQNADDYLVARVARARADGGTIWLVTDDGGLRAQAEACCEAFIGCDDWARFLRQGNG